MVRLSWHFEALTPLWNWTHLLFMNAHLYLSQHLLGISHYCLRQAVGPGTPQMIIRCLCVVSRSSCTDVCLLVQFSRRMLLQCHCDHVHLVAGHDLIFFICSTAGARHRSKAKEPSGNRECDVTSWHSGAPNMCAPFVRNVLVQRAFWIWSRKL